VGSGGHGACQVPMALGAIYTYTHTHTHTHTHTRTTHARSHARTHTHTGASITAICSDRNSPLVLQLGADRVVDYTQAPIHTHTCTCAHTHTRTHARTHTHTHTHTHAHSTHAHTHTQMQGDAATLQGLRAAVGALGAII